ncbi:hypothetical protein EXIGLDRAFT_721148 [Exidia glandulosa HHB12029]|uniref:Glycosyl transferase family 1 domain-containing protein n=1 Tax=Exidia glandulosa HHB12029 TaxID=1314781 RepID=A0A165FWW5_EXIGL|nr:hypothetical protein EXIGLDRAFT_721148 [Exidia glandulosa HHB12029]
MSKTSFNLAVVSCDGLPVSGLLTILRNVLDLVHKNPDCPPMLNHPIAIDLGYSWRADKAAFFPSGPSYRQFPDIFKLSQAVPVQFEGYNEFLLRIRNDVARADVNMSAGDAEELRERIEAIAAPYQSYFERWFEENDVDWVIAVNMTLSDGVPATTALHRAAERRWGSGSARPGGVLFWDHDLFRSCSVWEQGQRIYPERPNAFTLLPSQAWHRWAIVSEVLQQETAEYPTPMRAKLVPNVLPSIRRDRSPEFVDLLMRYLKTIDVHVAGDGDDWPMIFLVPVRTIPIKGADVALRVFAAMTAVLRARGVDDFYLLIFGDLDEDAVHGAELRALTAELNLDAHVRFLGGVPTYTFDTPTGPKLDETDLLALCAMSHGGVLFTPKVPDVESVGLGPALAATVGVPCLVSPFEAMRVVYGEELSYIQLESLSPGSIIQGAEQLVDLVLKNRAGNSAWQEAAAKNKTLMSTLFPDTEWKELLLALAAEAGVAGDVVACARDAFF